VLAKGNLNLQLRNKTEELRTRGKAQTINPLNNLLTALGSDLDNPPDQTRAFVYESDPVPGKRGFLRFPDASKPYTVSDYSSTKAHNRLKNPPLITEDN
jgi:hypothetical protein